MKVLVIALVLFKGAQWLLGAARKGKKLTFMGSLALFVGVLVAAGVLTPLVFQEEGQKGTPSAGRDGSGAQARTVNPPPAEGEISLDRNFYIVVDGSGSMTEAGCSGRFGNRIVAAKWAVKEFIEKGVAPNVALGLYVFDGAGSSERVPLGKDNRRQIVAAVDAIRGAGGTPLNASITKGAEVLAHQREKQLGYGEFYLIVATDGQATDGPGDAADGVRAAAQQGIPIITIGYCLPQSHALARQSASYRDANNPDELLVALKESQAESPYFDAAAFRR